MAQLTGTALDDAIRQKAEQGKGVTDPANQAAYDKYRAAYDAEIARKAANKIPLAGNSKGVITAANQNAYAGAVATQNKPAEVNTSSIIANPTPTTNTGTPQNYIDQLNAARRNQVLADLGKSRDNALSNLAGERSAIAPKYYDQRNQVAAGAQQQARNFAEFMAARGGTSSGANAQAELSRNMTTQGNLGTLGRQEAADYSDIERRTTGVNNAYQSDLASANAGIEADRMKYLLDDYYNEQQRQLQIAGLTGIYNNQKTLAGNAQDWSQFVDLANLSGEIPTTGGNGFRLTEQFDPKNKLAGRRTLQGQRFDRDVLESDREFNYQQKRDQIADKQWKTEFDEDTRRYGIDDAWRRYQEKQVSARAAASGGGSSGGSPTKAPSTTTVINNIDKLFRSYDPSTRSYSISDPEGLINFVVNSYPDDPQYDDEIDMILRSYGVSSPASGASRDRPVSGLLPME